MLQGIFHFTFHAAACSYFLALLAVSWVACLHAGTACLSLGTKLVRRVGLGLGGGCWWGATGTALSWQKACSTYSSSPASPAWAGVELQLPVYSQLVRAKMYW